MRPLPMISRSCGECHECCVAFALIPEPPWWDEYKPVGASCRYLCVGGCAIHDSPRPEICTQFRCFYLEGLAPNRPDQCGLIFHRASNETVKLLPVEGNVITVTETKPQAIMAVESKKLRYWWRKMQHPVLQVLPYGFDCNDEGAMMRTIGGRDICVGWKDDPSYAHAVIEWWRRN